MKFGYKNTALVPEKQLLKWKKKVGEEIKNMHKASKMKYEDDRASINLPLDKDMLKSVKKLIKEKSKLKPSYVVVAGIGGAILGTKAVQEAVLGKMYNQLDPKVKLLLLDTVDSDLLNDAIRIIEPVLKKRGNIILVGASKSGGTTETIVNFEVILNVIKKYKRDFQKYVVVISERDSKYWDLAQKNMFEVLENPNKVGGRYSVFCPIGLFPLGMVGINVGKLLEGAASMRKNCLKKDMMKNPAALSAILHYVHYRKKACIADLFLFSTSLEAIGKWYRQLMGESVGKEFNNKGKRVHNGMTPTVSIGTTDLHSVTQLYLAGPFNRLTTFVSLENKNSKVKVPNFKPFSKLVENIQGKPLEVIMDAILKGVKLSFKDNRRPFIEIILKDNSEASIGEFLQFKMMEMMYLGYLMDVNPFDQPKVEGYKIETKKILAK